MGNEDQFDGYADAEFVEWLLHKDRDKEWFEEPPPDLGASNLLDDVPDFYA